MPYTPPIAAIPLEIPGWIDKLHHIDQQLTLAVNGSDSIFWDNIAYCVTNTFAWSLVILTLVIIFFRNILHYYMRYIRYTFFTVVNHFNSSKKLCTCLHGKAWL